MALDFTELRTSVLNAGNAMESLFQSRLQKGTTFWSDEANGLIVRSLHEKVFTAAPSWTGGTLSHDYSQAAVWSAYSAVSNIPAVILTNVPISIGSILYGTSFSMIFKSAAAGMVMPTTLMVNGEEAVIRWTNNSVEIGGAAGELHILTFNLVRTWESASNSYVLRALASLRKFG